MNAVIEHHQFQPTKTFLGLVFAQGIGVQFPTRMEDGDDGSDIDNKARLLLRRAYLLACNECMPDAS